MASLGGYDGVARSHLEVENGHRMGERKTSQEGTGASLGSARAQCGEYMACAGVNDRETTGARE